MIHIYNPKKHGEARLPAGRDSVEFDASALPSGTYLYRMIAGDHVQTMQMVLSK